jgi:hypothetical protein
VELDVGATDGVGDGEAEELGEPCWLSRPVGGGLLGDTLASGTPAEWSSEAPLTAPELPSSAPAAQIIAITTAAVAAVAKALRRRYTDGGSGPCDSSTSGK